MALALSIETTTVVISRIIARTVVIAIMGYSGTNPKTDYTRCDSKTDAIIMGLRLWRRGERHAQRHRERHQRICKFLDHSLPPSTARHSGGCNLEMHANPNFLTSISQTI